MTFKSKNPYNYVDTKIQRDRGLYNNWTVFYDLKVISPDFFG